MKKWIIWILAVILTITAAIYQKMTGPTYPKYQKIKVDGKEYKIRFIRTNVSSKDAKISLNLPKEFSGIISYRIYPSDKHYIKMNFHRENQSLVTYLPKQPPAGKLEYFVILKYNNNVVFSNEQTPLRIRFKGEIPAYILILHILFMFTAMLLSTYSGLAALFKDKSQKIFGIITLIVLFIGGGILGPIVQKYAFGQYWTGIPFGYDLTDNKTLIALVFWIIAVIANLKKERFFYTILASIILILVYSIPHSLFGSQLNYNTGQVTQGLIFLLFYFNFKQLEWKNL